MTHTDRALEELLKAVEILADTVHYNTNAVGYSRQVQFKTQRDVAKKAIEQLREEQ